MVSKLSFEALEPIRQGVRRCFGAFAKEIARGLAVRHDHGSQYMSNAFQQELGFLGIASSPAFVRAPEGNGCAERFIRTLKENLLWVRTFDTVEERAGSGFLNRLDRWSLCLTAARMAAEQERR